MGRNILVTGGAGYIGSVAVEQLLARGETPIVLDDLSTGHRAAVPAGVEFIRGNVGDRTVLDALFAGRSIDALMHFAAFALVAESVAAIVPSLFQTVTGDAIGARSRRLMRQDGRRWDSYLSASTFSAAPARFP